MADSNITKNALAASLKQLMLEKPFEKISVSDICDRCGMNRKSFYYHFKDKYDLVNWIFYTDFIGNLKFNEYSKGWDVMLDLCRHFYQDKAFYRAAFKIEGQNSLKDYVLETLEPITRYFMQGSEITGEDEEFFVAFFGDAFLSAIMRWLREGMQHTPEEFIGKLHSLGIGLAEKVLADEDTTDSP